MKSETKELLITLFVIALIAGVFAIILYKYPEILDNFDPKQVIV